MNASSSTSLEELVSELLASADEVTSLAKDSEIESESLTEFAGSVGKVTHILCHIMEKKEFVVVDSPQIRQTIESLETELQHAVDFIRSSNSRASLKQIEEVNHDFGRLLGRLLLLIGDNVVPLDFKEEIVVLREKMLNGNYFVVCSDSEELAISGDGGGLEEIGEEEEMHLKIDDVALQLKYGSDEKFRYALAELRASIMEKRVDREWISDEGIISILFNRLGSNRCFERLDIIQILRIIVLENEQNKERMADVDYLTTLVKSLARDPIERREAVGLLMDLCDLTAVRRRIGRIRGCILMLVTILKGDDPLAARDAEKLLNALSQNTQNALHMAESGYFQPLVQHLKYGSKMSKILMANALSRMILTDQGRLSLGENGAIEPLIMMSKTGKLEAKLAALNALQNLSISSEIVPLMITSGIISPLIQLLFSVTSSVISLRVPAAALLTRIAQADPTLINKDMASQMLLLISFSSPVIQSHLLQALHSIAAHTSASKLRCEMKQNGAIELLLPFLNNPDTRIRTGALNLLYIILRDLPEELSQLLGEENIRIIVGIVSSSVSHTERDAGISLLSIIPIEDKKATEVLKSANFLPILVSIMSSSSPSSLPAVCWLVECGATILIRFSDPSDKKLQHYAAEIGIISLLLKLLSDGSMMAKCRAATSLAQLSQNSLSLRRSRVSRWSCIPHTMSVCDVHDGYCSIKGSFCLIKAGVIPPLIDILLGKEREADEAILSCLSTLLQDGICENGSNYIAKASGVEAIIKVLESGTVKAKQKALWMMERIFCVEAHRLKYGESAQVVLIGLAQDGDTDTTLKSMVAKILAQLELLQDQSSYF
ncbi:hypothetical protein Nepgr_017549 [Nepenthes gracilis]|uniref:Uncharacterized protein n=1 Tax=Nepenthes gracilis TaxID=150966 RepID=A0AAD3SPJ6_NEPGR|nr:hypothetical protein Nepgr_017549 [Nepenthes gracilis]